MERPPKEICHLPSHLLFFEAQCHGGGLVVAVPGDMLRGGRIDEEAYLTQGWAHVNNLIQENPIGSHLFPDVEKPIEAGESRAEEHLARLKKWLSDANTPPKNS